MGVSLFVEGGSILYDEAGLLSATGTADTALAFAGAYDVEAAAADADADAGNNSTTTEEGVRRLRSKRGSNGYYNKKPRSPGGTCDMETVATQLLESEWNSGRDYKQSEHLVNTALQTINDGLFYLVEKNQQKPECQAGGKPYYQVTCDMKKGADADTINSFCTKIRISHGLNDKKKSPVVTCDMETMATQLLESEWNKGGDYKESEYLVNVALQEINYELFYQLETLVGKTNQIPECQAGGKPYYQVTCDMKKGDGANTINKICTTFERDGLNVG